MDVLRKGGGRYTWRIAELRLDDGEKGHTMRWAVEMENALPSGLVRASGRFGPLVEHNLAETLLSGSFTFTRVNLHDVGNIKGTLSSSGKFFGKLGAIEANATSQTPDFAVDDGRPTPVSGTIQCTISGLNGDTTFRSIDLRIGRTDVSAIGMTAGNPEKSTDLNITVKSGRAEDVLRPFVHNDVPIIGPVSLRAHAYLAPASVGGFFHRLKVDGTFDVPAERATDAKTEKSLTDFSHRAQDKNSATQPNPPADGDGDALSSIAGPASIRDEIVTTNGLQFKVSGAEANLHGTFAIHTLTVHMTGDLKMDNDISHTATGFKAFLLKPIAPFFKKKNAGALVPIAVTGTPGKYKVEADLNHKK
jgi:hypothetical protein